MGPRPLTGVGCVGCRRGPRLTARGRAGTGTHNDIPEYLRAVRGVKTRSAVRAGAVPPARPGPTPRRQVAGSDPGSQPAEREPMFTFGLMVRIGTALGPGAVRDALTTLRGRYPTREGQAV